MAMSARQPRRRYGDPAPHRRAVWPHAGRDPARLFALYHYIDNHADLLSQDWADAHFDFHMRRLNGIEQQRPLDKQALDLLARPPVAEQMGRLYAARYFPPESKAAIDKLVAFLRAAFRERLAQSEWMDAAHAPGGDCQARCHHRQDRLPGPMG
jgi:predicted metalloendopeptidase